ncbi:uncharacterized protein [Procambarus clarkii]|uniref:uncharacterized protein n=1 Tax=Procambarus clarkii TaxID=6728 RepID=UPI003743DB1E
MSSVRVLCECILENKMRTERDHNVSANLIVGVTERFYNVKCKNITSTQYEINASDVCSALVSGGRDSSSLSRQKSFESEANLSKVKVKRKKEIETHSIPEGMSRSEVGKIEYKLSDKVKVVGMRSDVASTASLATLVRGASVAPSAVNSEVYLAEGDPAIMADRLNTATQPLTPARNTRLTHPHASQHSLTPDLVPRPSHQQPILRHSTPSSVMAQKKGSPAISYDCPSPVPRRGNPPMSPHISISGAEAVDVAETSLNPLASLSAGVNKSSTEGSSVDFQSQDDTDSHRLGLLSSTPAGSVTPAGDLSSAGLVTPAGRTASFPASRTSPAASRTTGHILEVAVLLITFLLATPVAGRYDRGGPQHSITWGRGNSHSSAVFGNLPTNVTAVLGHRARLPCQVKNLGLKDVSWIRQRDLHILTVGIFTYTSDDRFKVFHPPEAEDWYLDISSVTFRDAGVYECQVSTSPKVSLPIHLTVLAVQEADILGPREVYIQHGSTISLHCEVLAGVEAVGPVRWLRGASTLNYSSPRGGISMEVEKTPTKTMSKLYITRAVKADSGNYTCAPLYARPDSVIVHVVNAGEESAAAVQSGVGALRAGVGVVWVATLLATWLRPPPPPAWTP